MSVNFTVKCRWEHIMRFLSVFCFSYLIPLGLLNLYIAFITSKNPSFESLLRFPLSFNILKLFVLGFFNYLFANVYYECSKSSINFFLFAILFWDACSQSYPEISPSRLNKIFSLGIEEYCFLSRIKYSQEKYCFIFRILHFIIFRERHPVSLLAHIVKR